MSDLPVCRLCGMHPVFVAENVLFHEHNPDQPCPLTTDHFSVAQWRTLMAVPGGEAVAEAFAYVAHGAGIAPSSDCLLVSAEEADDYDPRCVSPVYITPHPAVDGAVQQFLQFVADECDDERFPAKAKQLLAAMKGA